MNLSDKEFLELQCSQLNTAHIEDIIAIKDCSNRLLAISSQYSIEFMLDKDKVFGQNISIIGINLPTANKVLEYEISLHQSNKLQELIYIHQGVSGAIYYYVRKQLIINPFSSNIVGINVRMDYFTPNHFRKIFLQLTHPSLIKLPFSDIMLTDIQNEIIFCLMLGYNSRKEITSFIHTYLPNYYTEHMIKNTLAALYKKFNCNTTTRLLNVVINKNIKVKIPKGVLECGIFLIQR